MTRATRVWLPVFTVVVFSAGVATGVILNETLEPRSIASEATSTATGGPPAGDPASLLAARLARELDLTRDQQQRLEALVAARRQSFLVVREALRARLENDASGLVSDIQQHLDLTPQQRKRFDAFVARIRASYVRDEPLRSPNK
jgi:hypothetical protein